MTRGERLRQMLRDLAAFTLRERRGILWFIPIIIVVSMVVAALTRPRFEQSLQLAADNAVAPAPAPQDEAPGPILSCFDPNTIDYRGLRTLGFSAKAAAGILRYRQSGKVFRIKEDFAACWDVGDSIFFALEPYIVIAPEFAVKRTVATREPHGYAARPASASARPAARCDSLFAFDPNALDAEGFRLLGFSARQAEAIVNRREQIRGFRSADEFGECYVVSGEMLARLKPYIRIDGQPAARAAAQTAAPERKTPVRVELNTADSTALVAVRGIGALTAGRILDYRARLGGFVSAEQLAGVRGVTEENYERILQQISIDSSIIQKIDINFAAPEKLSGHPYISPEMLRKIVKNRQLKGGWSTTEDMIDDGTITAAQAVRLAPYLKFNTNLNR